MGVTCIEKFRLKVLCHDFIMCLKDMMCFGTAKALILAFSSTLRSVQFCMMVTSVELHTFVIVLVTFINLHGHSSIRDKYKVSVCY